MVGYKKAMLKFQYLELAFDVDFHALYELLLVNKGFFVVVKRFLVLCQHNLKLFLVLCDPLVSSGKLCLQFRLVLKEFFFRLENDIV